MKFFAGVLAVAVAVPGLAHAGNNISGTYSVHLTEVCQSIENEIFKPSTQIQTIDEGKITQTIGLITFTPTKAGGLSGAVSASFTQANGTLTILGLPGGTGQPGQPAKPDMQIGSATQSGTYSMTAGVGNAPGTLKITFKGDNLNNFTAYMSQPAGGIYGHVDFIDIESNNETAPTCANSGTLVRSSVATPAP